METFKITDLKAGVREKDRVNIFLNGEFSFSLDLAQVVEFKLKIGKILLKEEVERLKRASTFGKLYNSTLEWVFMRTRSIHETEEYLRLKLRKREQTNRQRERNKEKLKENPKLREKIKEYKLYTKKVELFTDEDIKNVVKKLIEKKYLDDEKFAEFYVENFRVKKGVSERKLREELRKKGISGELIDRVLESSERKPEDEVKKIILKKKGKYKTKEKLLAYILRQGFPYDLAKNAVEESFSSD